MIELQALISYSKFAHTVLENKTGLVQNKATHYDVIHVRTTIFCWQ